MQGSDKINKELENAKITKQSWRHGNWNENYTTRNQ